MSIEVLTMLLQIIAGITLLALLWLTARAFKKGLAWGFGVLLFSPFSATAFGIRFWDREKLPFLVYMGLFISTAALLASLFDAWGGWELLKARGNAQAALQTQTLTQAHANAFRKASLSFAEKSGLQYQDKRLHARIKHQFDRVAEVEEISARARTREEQVAQEKGYSYEGLFRRAPKKKERYRLVYKPIRVGEAGNYIGSTIKLIRRNVQEREYRLVGVSGNSLQLSQKNGSGYFSFSIKQQDIEKIRVLTRKSY